MSLQLSLTLGPAMRLFGMNAAISPLRLSKSSPTIGFLLLFGLFRPLAGQAQGADGSSPDVNSSMPLCSPQMEGQVYCKFGTVYECRPVEPNSSQRGTGWHWKMDILRAC